MTIVIRAIAPADIDRLVELNNAATPAVPHTTLDEFGALLRIGGYAMCAEDLTDDPSDDSALLGFVITMNPGQEYASENYRYFQSRGVDHLYVDRIVVDESRRGERIGARLYSAVFDRARADARAEVTCEVNVEPPNPRSLAFHARLGFSEVGRQATKGGTVVVALLAASVTP